METLFLKRIHGFKTSLNLVHVEVSGLDSRNFLQGQTTNNVFDLKSNEVQYNCFLNRMGRIESFFVLRCVSDNLFQLWLDPSLLNKTIERIEKYIIADDVEIKIFNHQEYTVIGGLEALMQQKGIPYLYFNEPVVLVHEDLKLIHYPELVESEKNFFYYERGFYSLYCSQEDMPLLNETMMMKLAWNKDKGCFLGQEIVQKVYSRGGAAHVPFKLKLDFKFHANHSTSFTMGDRKFKSHGSLEIKEKTFLYALLPKQWQISGLEVELTIDDHKTQSTLEAIDPINNLGDEIYHYAVEKFTLFSQADEAIKLIILLINSQALLKPSVETLAEWHESLGAIYGKINRFEDAITQMEQVAKLLPYEVMPYTNLSLYAMKLGRIEEAEKFKEEATLKSFLKLGQEAKKKQQEKEKNFAREKMFHDVLAIDEYDAMALCGLAEIDLARGSPAPALEKLEKLYSVNDRYTQAYILMGRAQELLGDLQEAKNIWQKGLSLALGKGELMPAQQIQSLLHKISQ